MKKYPAVIAAAVLSISLITACAYKDRNVYKDIYKRYSDIQSFYAEAEVTVRNPRGKNKYKIRQSYTAPDEYILAVDEPEQLAGSGYIFRGEKTILKSGFGKDDTSVSVVPDTKNCFFISDFFAAYYENENSSAKTDSGVSSGKTSFESSITAENGDMLKQILVIGNKDLLPLKLITYDTDGSPRITVEFEKFSVNTDSGSIDF